MITNLSNQFNAPPAITLRIKFEQQSTQQLLRILWTVNFCRFSTQKKLVSWFFTFADFRYLLYWQGKTWFFEFFLSLLLRLMILANAQYTSTEQQQQGSGYSETETYHLHIIITWRQKNSLILIHLMLNITFINLILKY